MRKIKFLILVCSILCCSLLVSYCHSFDENKITFNDLELRCRKKLAGPTVNTTSINLLPKERELLKKWFSSFKPDYQILGYLYNYAPGFIMLTNKKFTLNIYENSITFFVDDANSQFKRKQTEEDRKMIKYLLRILNKSLKNDKWLNDKWK